MTSSRAILRQDWTGEILFAVQAHCVPSEAMSPPRALALQLGQRWLTLLSDPNEPLLHILPGPLPLAGERALVAVDWSARDPFARFLHCPLYSWWLLENELGGEDGLFLAFDAENGVLVLAQRAGIEVLVVSHPAGRATAPDRRPTL